MFKAAVTSTPLQVIFSAFLSPKCPLIWPSKHVKWAPVRNLLCNSSARAAHDEAPVVEAPVVEAPVVEAPVVEAPVVGAPVVGAPVVEAPVGVASVVVASAEAGKT